MKTYFFKSFSRNILAARRDDTLLGSHQLLGSAELRHRGRPGGHVQRGWDNDSPSLRGNRLPQRLDHDSPSPRGVHWPQVGRVTIPKPLNTVLISYRSENTFSFIVCVFHHCQLSSFWWGWNYVDRWWSDEFSYVELLTRGDAFPCLDWGLCWNIHCMFIDDAFECDGWSTAWELIIFGTESEFSTSKTVPSCFIRVWVFLYLCFSRLEKSMGLSLFNVMQVLHFIHIFRFGNFSVDFYGPLLPPSIYRGGVYLNDSRQLLTDHWGFNQASPSIPLSVRIHTSTRMYSLWIKTVPINNRSQKLFRIRALDGVPSYVYGKLIKKF